MIDVDSFMALVDGFGVMAAEGSLNFNILLLKIRGNMTF